MKELIELFINGNLDITLNEDYQKKLNNIQYIKLLETDSEQIELKTLLLWLNENSKLDRLLEEIRNIKTEFLYQSFTHGVNHNERVLFWSYYLGIKCELDERSMRIVLDGAKYHDIGRKNDLLDPDHGKRSANIIEKVVEDPIYRNPQNINLLKGIMELHSLSDKNADQIMKKYKIEDKSLFYTLFSILKDADALDRVRLTYMKKRFSSLNPSYLRIPYSKQLLRGAHELNEFYEKKKGDIYEKHIY